MTPALTWTRHARERLAERAGPGCDPAALTGRAVRVCPAWLYDRGFRMSRVHVVGGVNRTYWHDPASGLAVVADDDRVVTVLAPCPSAEACHVIHG